MLKRALIAAIALTVLTVGASTASASSPAPVIQAPTAGAAFTRTTTGSGMTAIPITLDLGEAAGASTYDCGVKMSSTSRTDPADHDLLFEPEVVGFSAYSCTQKDPGGTIYSATITFFQTQKAGTYYLMASRSKFPDYPKSTIVPITIVDPPAPAPVSVAAPAPTPTPAPTTTPTPPSAALSLRTA